MALVQRKQKELEPWEKEVSPTLEQISWSALWEPIRRFIFGCVETVSAPRELVQYVSPNELPRKRQDWERIHVVRPPQYL